MCEAHQYTTCCLEQCSVLILTSYVLLEERMQGWYFFFPLSFSSSFPSMSSFLWSGLYGDCLYVWQVLSSVAVSVAVLAEKCLLSCALTDRWPLSSVWEGVAFVHWCRGMKCLALPIEFFSFIISKQSATWLTVTLGMNVESAQVVPAL